ncbi:MAG: hypothetical protein WAV05_00700, partial [Anaerolineales bacterium]
FETGKAGLLACFQATEESGVGFVQAAKHMLQAGRVQLAERVRVSPTQITEMRPLRSIANALARFPIGFYALFQGGVVDQSGLPEQKVQSFSLLGAWAKEILVGTQHGLARFLHFDIPSHGLLGNLPHPAHIVAVAPHAWKTGAQFRLFQTQHSRPIPLERMVKTLWRFARVTGNEHMNMIRHDFHCFDGHIQFLGFLVQQVRQILRNPVNQHFTSIFWTPDEVNFVRKDTACIASIAWVNHRTSVLQNSSFVNYLTCRKEGAASPVA